MNSFSLVTTRRVAGSVSKTKICTLVARFGSSTENQHGQSTIGSNPDEHNREKSQPQNSKKKKTQAEVDEELRLKMSGLSGDGGAAGIEYEDGQPVAMKRSVRENMFRYI